MVVCNCTPRTWPSSVHSDEVNCAPRSDVISSGRPKRDIQCLMRASAHVLLWNWEGDGFWPSSKAVDDGKEIHHSFAGGNGPTRSTCRHLKRPDGGSL